MTTEIPTDLIPAINRLVRASRTLFTENGREPLNEELAARLSLPLAKVETLRAIARQPIRLQSPAGR